MKRRRISLAHGNVRLAFTDSGEAMAPVVLVHGLGGSQLAFKCVGGCSPGR